jgi:hypothetical protein
MPIAFQWALGLVADHGYRPGKVVYVVLVTLVVFWSIFWFLLNIVAFDPESKKDGKKETTSQSEQITSAANSVAPPPLPIGFLFLFDRLIPAFQISEQNYSIGTVYGRARPYINFWPRKMTLPGANHPDHKIKYLLMTHRLVPLDQREKDRFEKWLIALRIIGVAWGVFLLAAINALIKH